VAQDQHPASCRVGDGRAPAERLRSRRRHGNASGDRSRGRNSGRSDGDIAPLHSYAHSLANIEPIIGQIYPATPLAQLVTLEIENR
jgi:hypothetical protein